MVSGMVTRNQKGAQLHYYIKEHMEERGISDGEMAHRIGVSRETVWKRYSDQRRLDPFKIEEFAKALGMHPSELLFPPGTPSLDAIANGATPDQRAMAADIVRRMMEKS